MSRHPDLGDPEAEALFIARFGQRPTSKAPKAPEAKGYHLRPILTQGTYGEPSKIREELEELEESLEQDNRILAMCELADLYGAIEGVAEKLGVSMQDVIRMAEATKRAFKDGSRRPKTEAARRL